jgi:TrmH family RNA methyltransferase
MVSVTAESLVKQAKRLKRKTERERIGFFIVEGKQNVDAAIAAGAQIIGLLTTESGLQFPIAGEWPTFAISAKQFREVSDTVTPQGLLAIVKKPDYTISALPKNPRTLVYLEVIQDPGNLGTIIRTADAFGADGVLLSPGCVDPFNEKCVRSSAGSIFNLPVISEIDLTQLRILANNYQAKLLVTSLLGTILLSEIQISDYTCTIWAIGNEANGISPELANIADQTIKIPMLGKAESLNAAIAAAVCLYASASYISTLKA